MYDAQLAKQAQDKYCLEHEIPHFAPHNGICWNCNRNIYDDGGISVEESGSRLITGCPFCHRSYVD